MNSEDLVSVLVPLGLFATIAAISISVVIAKRRVREAQFAAIRDAIAQGVALDPALLARMERPVRSAEADLRSGIILCSVGIGLAIAGVLPERPLRMLVNGGEDGNVDPSRAGEVTIDGSFDGLLAVAVIVAMLGIGHLVSWAVRRHRPAA
jgi:hypothetical protein